jgi:hypothetical protein
MSKGSRNRDSGHHVKSAEVRRKNDKDEAVARDPDIAGVNRRESNDVHARARCNNEGRG